MGVVSFKGSLLLMAFLIHTVLTAPVIEENTELLGPDQIAEGKGCYYNYEHYDEGDRILTNEPCLNCTCHNRMLMCYLRVCPFTKAIGQDCKVEKKPDQCCPVITCPQVPVALLTSSTTETTASTATAVGHPDSYGCVLDDNVFYADGAQVPSDPRKPCELCYCIRNQTACVMQECTLNVEGCKPVYQEGVCCPVRYDCDYDEVLTTPRPTAGLITTPGGPNECKANEQIYQDGEMINNMTTNPCEHCYCMRGDVVCAVQECGTPLENTECTPMPAEPGQCCPSTYQCPNGTVPAHVLQATPNLKPSPPIAPSLAHIKPDTETEKPNSEDVVNEGNEATHDGKENESTGVKEQEPGKIVGLSDSTVAETSEVITEAPKDVAIIEIITTAAPQEVTETQTQESDNQVMQTNMEQHPEEQGEISSVPELIPEQDQVEEGHAEEEHDLQEGHIEDEQDHNVEATTAPGHYTEISVENVEMNTSPPEKAKPEILSASHSLGEDESVNVNTEVPQELTTVGPSSAPVEQLPQNENQEVNNQEPGHDGSVEPESQDAISQPEHPDEISQPEHQGEDVSQAEYQGTTSQPEHQDITAQPGHQDEEVVQPEHQDEVSHPEHQDEISQPEHQDEISLPEHQDEISQAEHQDEISQPGAHDEISQPGNLDKIDRPEHQEEISQAENQDTTSQPEHQDEISQPEQQENHSQDVNQHTTTHPDVQGSSIQPEIQETTIQPQIQEVINQLDNQEASSQQDNLEALHPGNQESSQQEIVASPTELSPSSQQVNEELSSQKENVASPTEPAPSSQRPQEPLPEENEKPSVAQDLTETSPAPVSTTTTTEQEPIEMSRIPGEGSCLYKGITYAPNTEVMSENPCKRCRCVNSIVECKDPECPEPPITLYSNCVPMPPTDDACCPTYFCEQNPSQEPEVDSMSIDKIDQGVEEGAPEEGIAPTTIASVHEDNSVEPEHFVPGTHEISDYTNQNVEDVAQPESPVSEDADEAKPSGEGSQPESVVPSGEDSEQQLSIPSEGSQPEIVAPSEVAQPESDPSESSTEPKAPVDASSVDITTALPQSSSDHERPSFDQHEESPAVAIEDVHPVSQDNVESESSHESIPTTEPTKVISEEQGSKLEEAQSISETSQTTTADEQLIVTERPQRPGVEQLSFDGSEGSEPMTEHSVSEITAEGSTAQSELEKPQETPVEQVPINEKLEETIETTVAPTHDDVESGQDTESQHSEMTNQEVSNVEGAHDGQEVTEVESSGSGAVSTDAPDVPIGQNEGAEHDSVPSGSSQPIEAEAIPTIDQSENDLTATHDQNVPESPTTAIPEEASSVHTDYNEALLPSTEGPSGASENPETPEPMVTAGPPVLFPDISHQGAPIHIPGPVGINTDGLTSEDERLGETEAPIQEHTQTEQPKGSEESSSSGNVQQPSEGDINSDGLYTTEGLGAAVSHQTEGVANEVVSGIVSEDNQITESSQTSKPSVHDDVNEILPPEQEQPLSGDRNVGEVLATEGAVPATEVSQTVTEASQGQIQHHDEAVHPTQDESEIQPTHDESEIQPTHDESDIKPTHDESDIQPTHDESEIQPTPEDTQVSQGNSGTEVPPAHGDTEISPAHGEADIPPAHSDADVPTDQGNTDVPPAHGDADVPPAHGDADVPTDHEGTQLPPAHGDAETSPAHEDTQDPTAHDDTEIQPTHDESEVQQIHDGSEAEPTHEETFDKTVTGEKPADQQVETESPSILEQSSTEKETILTDTPQGPIVTHGDLPTPSEPSAENVILPHSENETEKQPEPPQTQQPLDTEISASQPAIENIEHEKVESDSEQTQEVTQVPESEEVVTHIDSAGPQQVPEIANQIVETETNAIEHATGLEHEEEPSAPGEADKTGNEEIANPDGDHHEPIEQEQPLHPEEPQSIPEEHIPDVAPSVHEQQPEVVPSLHQEVHPESDQVPNLEDHSEGHEESLLEENQEKQTEQPTPEGQSEQHQPEPHQPELEQTEIAESESSTQVPEHTNVEETLPEGQQETAQPEAQPEEIVQPLPEAAQDENQPEQTLVEGHLEQQEPKPEQTHVDNTEVSHSDIAEEQPQTTKAPELPEAPQDPEATPEKLNVVSGQQIEKDETQPAVSEQQELPDINADKQEAEVEQEHDSNRPSTDEQVTNIEGNHEQVLMASEDSAPAATGEEGSQTPAPSGEDKIHTEGATAAPEQPEVAGDHQQSTIEADKIESQTPETTPTIQGEDQQQTQEEPATPEGQPNEPIAPSSEAEPSSSDLSTTAAEEAPVESGPSAPSAPESAPSAPEAVPPEEPSAPESIVPEQPSVPESSAPQQPSAPEYTAPEQPSGPESEVVPSAPESDVRPSAPEQPIAPETQPSSLGQDEVPAPHESDIIPSQPDQSSHLVEEIEKEQPILETSSSPTPELLQSSPLPPVEIPSTEGPVLPPGLQTWSQKPYHPPSLPEHQQHHQTAEVPHLPEDSHYPSQPYDQDYEDDDNVSYGPGTCRYGGKVYLSAQQIPRDDPCDFCFCFRSDIICLQQSCPPPIRGCYQETIKGFCCPRYECHVSMATMVNITTTSTTTTTTVPPHFLSHHYNGSAMKAGCQVKGIAYKVGDRIPSTSGPCLDCRCGADGQMKCDPTVCGPQESLLRQVMAASVSKRRRR